LHDSRRLFEYLSALRSIRDKLTLFEVDAFKPVSTVRPTKASKEEPARRQTPMQQPETLDVFLVHGHDDGAKYTVAYFLKTIGLQPVILHEQAGKGRTIIQKFEDHANVRFAVVLLTPDDEGGVRGLGQVKPRARQNVVFELGYFRGKLGPEHVCALMADGVEIPSDINGVTYIPFDTHGSRKADLVRELRAAHFEVNY
jgi:predicted nucleotide-binding protein